MELIYSSAPPTQPGWYWFKMPAGLRGEFVEEIVRVDFYGQELEFILEHSNWSSSVNQPGCWWAGPLEKPRNNA